MHLYALRVLLQKKMLAATLRFLAEGSYQHGVGKDFNVAIGQPTFSVAFAKCIKILEDTLAPKWIDQHGTGRAARFKALLFFFAKSEIPGVVMCADGTHIKIIAPIENRDQHYNSKGYYSINALIVSKEMDCFSSLIRNY